MSGILRSWPTLGTMVAEPVTPVTLSRAVPWVRRGSASTMTVFHQHDDLEINMVVRGELDYLFGGEHCVIPAGHVGLFWAAAPHRMVGPEPSPDDDIGWAHLPLPTVLGWDLPASFGNVVLAQRTIVVPTDDVAAHLPSLLTTWQRDLAAGVPLDAMLHEAHALVTRILDAHERRLAAGAVPVPKPESAGQRARSSRVAMMARHVAANFREPISTADVARAVGLNPNYATTLFREAVGVTVGEQLVRHRLAEAQRLLVTTTLTTESVAHSAGFGSSSNFYDHFVRLCGCTPGEYRADRRLR